MQSLNPYLIFDGNCGEAMTFYAKCLNAELELSLYSSMPFDVPDAEKNRILHARLSTGSMLLMASDNRPGMPLTIGNNVSVNIGCESVAEIELLYAAFLEGGKADMPLDDTFWGARFGMLTDKFGIHWMFNFEYPKHP